MNLTEIASSFPSPASVQPNEYGVLRCVRDTLRKGEATTKVGQRVQFISGPGWNTWDCWARQRKGLAPFALIASERAMQDPQAERIINALKNYGYPWRELPNPQKLNGETRPAVVTIVCDGNCFLPENNYHPGLWNSVYEQGLNPTTNFCFNPLNRLAIVIFGERMWKSSYYDNNLEQRVFLTLRHELGHLLSVLATGVGKEGVYPATLWEALADIFAGSIEECFGEKQAQPSLAEIRADPKTRSLGKVSSLVNTLLWGAILHLGQVASFRNQSPEKFLQTWQTNRQIETARRRFSLGGLPSALSLPQSRGARRAAFSFLQTLRKETRDMPPDSYHPSWLKKLLSSELLIDPREMASLFLEDKDFLKNYLYPLPLLRSGKTAFSIIDQKWQKEVPCWQPYGKDSFKE